jgi:hypothetical protein
VYQQNPFPRTGGSIVEETKKQKPGFWGKLFGSSKKAEEEKEIRIKAARE